MEGSLSQEGHADLFTCGTAASLGFVSLTGVIEQLLVLLLGTCEFPVPEGWRGSQRQGDMDQDKYKMLFKALFFILAQDHFDYEIILLLFFFKGDICVTVFSLFLERLLTG